MAWGVWAATAEWEAVAVEQHRQEALQEAIVVQVPAAWEETAAEATAAWEATVEWAAIAAAEARL